MTIRNLDEDPKSRSQIKREFHALKDLGVQLAGLSKAQLSAIPMSERTREAILVAQGLTRTALQRQYRYLSSLLAEEDAATLQSALSGARRPHAQAVASLHEAEQWRDRLLSTDEAQLAAFAERYPDCDRSHLRTLVRNAKKERDLSKPPASARLLFRYVRQHVQQVSDPQD